MIRNCIIVGSVILFSACSSMPPTESRTGVSTVPITNTFMANYDYTWDAALNEMGHYDLKIVNKDAGSIVTNNMSTFEGRQERNEFRQHIDVKVTALGPDENNLPQTQVTVTKYILKLRGLERDKPVMSDTVEEKVILYRIKRLLEIERLKLERTGNKNTKVH